MESTHAFGCLMLPSVGIGKDVDLPGLQVVGFEGVWGALAMHLGTCQILSKPCASF